MNVHEYQAKALLPRFGVDVPRGGMARTADEAKAVAQALYCARYVVKAQVLAGDRMSGGGVRFAASPAHVEIEAASLLGRRLTTAQTSAEGLPVKRVYVEEEIDSGKSFYAAAMLDPMTGRLSLLASNVSGSAIETAAHERQDLVRRITLKVAAGAAEGDFDGLARQVCADEALIKNLAAFFRKLADASIALDATILEINPLAVVNETQLVALDAKLVIDDNALFRQADLRALYDSAADEDGDPIELEAQRYHVNYVRMDGDIGVVVNGAGLALATLDLLRDAGGRPANFMDIRTTASSLDIAYGFRLILENPNVRAILVNVHGGGMQRCDTIAEGIGIAVRRSNRALPIIICMAGNHKDFARVVLRNTGVEHIEYDDVVEAAQAAIDFAQKRGKRWLS